MADEDLTPREAAAELGVTVRTVQRWVNDGRLPARRVGSRMRVSRSSLDAVRGSSRSPEGRIRRLVIANRGEIAVRVARTARRLGMHVIGIHAADDRPPDGIDDARQIDSYLDGEQILSVARAAAADAVHPGYGFLAENAAFARAVAAAGLRWVGPTPAAIERMGDKASARTAVAAVGVPVLSGYDGTHQAGERLAAEAERIGYPLLVKPSAGGGGKGMRVVHAPHELGEAIAAARREAQRAFGDDRLILERYVARARHVEVQVLFDAYGAGVHLGERDCSAQRRNQKILEESPGPAVDAELRNRLGEAALAAARSVDYQGAGTVEFLLADDGAFWFLEMNTRLQVEHPVTELVTGRDLVADQLRIAAGEPLGLGQEDVRLGGHAMEVRLYAEDPEAGFLPSTGRILRLAWPNGVRIDTAVREGDLISDRYDPLLAKLIAHDANRDGALERLRRALAETSVLGLRTNLRFLRWLLAQPFVTDGELRTDTLTQVALAAPLVPPDEAWSAAAATLLDEHGPWGGGWRLNGPPAIRIRTGDDERSVAPQPGGAAAVRHGDAVHVDVEGQSVEFRLASPPSVEEAVRHASATQSGASVLTAPMPGRVVAVRASEGAPVEAHAPVVVIEAMKMEHAVVAPTAGTVTRLAVSEGQQVQRGDVLAEVSA